MPAKYLLLSRTKCCRMTMTVCPQLIRNRRLFSNASIRFRPFAQFGSRLFSGTVPTLCVNGVESCSLQAAVQNYTMYSMSAGKSMVMTYLWMTGHRTLLYSPLPAFPFHAAILSSTSILGPRTTVEGDMVQALGTGLANGSRHLSRGLSTAISASQNSPVQFQLQSSYPKTLGLPWHKG